MKASEVSKEWLMKQKVTISGKNNLYQYLYGSCHPGSVGRPYIKYDGAILGALSVKIVSLIFQIPEYEKYKGISEGFLTSHKRTSYSIVLSPQNFDPDYDYTIDSYGNVMYINEDTGMSWGGLRMIPKSIMKGIYKRFSNESAITTIDLSRYLGKGMSMPLEWCKELSRVAGLGYGVPRLKGNIQATSDLFISKLTAEQRLELKELFVKYLDHFWEVNNNHLQYNYGDPKKNEFGRAYFLSPITTMTELESDYPELVDKYLEANIDDLGPRYVKSLKGKAKDAYVSLKMKEKIEEIKEVLGYFN